MTPISTELLADGTLVLRPTGPIRVFAESEDGLLSAFDEAVHTGHVRIVLDLADTTAMDSAGFAGLVRGWTRVQRAGGDLVLARPAPSIKNLLTITRLITLFKTSDSVDDGLAQLRAAGHDPSAVATPAAGPTTMN